MNILSCVSQMAAQANRGNFPVVVRIGETLYPVQVVTTNTIFNLHEIQVSAEITTKEELFNLLKEGKE